MEKVFVPSSFLENVFDFSNASCHQGTPRLIFPRVDGWPHVGWAAVPGVGSAVRRAATWGCSVLLTRSPVCSVLAPSSFLFLVAMPGAPSSGLVTTSKALVTRSDALVPTSVLAPSSDALCS